MSFVTAAAIMGGASILGSLGGGLIGANASKKAARQQMQAINEAKGQITSSYREAQGYYTPYEDVGAQGLNQLRNLMEYKPMTLADMQLDPGYQFRLKESLKNILRQRAAGGSTFSGATQRDVSSYISNYASNEFNNAFNRRLTERQEQLRLPMYFTNMGAQVATNKANLATEYGSNIAGLIGQGGVVQAAGTMGAANAWSNALTGVAQGIGGAIEAYGKYKS